MHSLLQKLLFKLGVQSPEELPDDERKTFEEWKSFLAKETLSLEDVQNFCQSQVELIEGKWNDWNLPNERKAELIPYHTVYKNILLAINSPRSSRESLEKHLIELTK